MTQQTFIWTAIPNGIVTDAAGKMSLALSVVVAPRLTATPAASATTVPLSSFPDLIGASSDWITRARDLSFAVHFDFQLPEAPKDRTAMAVPGIASGGSVVQTGGPQEVVAMVKPDTSALDQARFRELFLPTTPVQPYAFEDLSQRYIVSYPVRNVVSHLKSLHQSVAAQSASALPLASALHPLLQAIAPYDPQHESLGITNDDANQTQRKTAVNDLMVQRDAARQSLKTADGGRAFLPEPVTPATDFGRLQWLHAPHGTRAVQQKSLYQDPAYTNPVWGSAKRAQLPTGAQLAAAIDFHQLVSAISRHRPVQCALGWAFDLQVPIDGLLFSAVGVSSVWVVPLSATGGQIAWAAPTASISPKTQYVLDADTNSFRPASRTTDIGNGMLLLNKSGTPYDIVQFDVDGAALKSINLAYNLVRSQSLTASGGNGRPSFDAADTVGLPAFRSRGLSLVMNGRALDLWHTLDQARQNNAMITAATPILPKLYAEDLLRGYRVDVGVVDPVTGNVNKWDSLCRRSASYRFLSSGVTLNVPEEEGLVQLALAQAADNTVDKDLYLHESLFTWSGWSLCARHIGNTLSSADTVVPDNSTPPGGVGLDTTFDVVPGSLPKLRFGTKYRIRLRLVDLAGNSRAYNDPSILAGVEASQGELYCRYDPVPPPALALVSSASLPGLGESMERLVIRSQNASSSMDIAPTAEMTHRALVAPAASQSLVETTGILDDVIGASKNAPSAAIDSVYDLLAARDGGALKQTPATALPGQQRYAVWEPGSTLPYLPDPFSRGATLTFTGPTPDIPHPPGLNEVIGLQFFPPEAALPWHSPRALQIQVKDVQQYTAQADGPPLVAQGQKVGADYDPATGILTVWLPKGEVARVRVSSTLGNPEPGLDGLDRLGKMGLWQWLKDLQLDERLAVTGHFWPITPYQDIVVMHAVQQPLITPALKSVTMGAALGDMTRAITFSTPLSSKTTSRLDVNADWSECVDDPSDSLGPRDADQGTLGEPRGPMPCRAHVAALSIALGTGENKFAGTFEHNFGDTKYRRVQYSAVATTRFSDCFPPDTVLTRASDPKDPNAFIHCPSTARPAAPVVRSVIPTFGWEAPPGTVSVFQKKRQGKGLRIYLERGWYSSGDGELLAVVIFPPNLSMSQSDPVKHVISCAGKDPLWQNNDMVALVPANFTLAAAVDAGCPLQGLSVAEVENQVVDVVPHRVQWDKDVQLWYCDIVIDLGAVYFPFVRLALARYQPHSITGAHISRVIQTDFAQLAPDRVAAININTATRSVNVMVSGPAYTSSGASVEKQSTSMRTPEFLIFVERRRQDVPDPDLGWGQDVSTVVPLATLPAGALYSADVYLPAPSGQFRLVIKEFERYYTDLAATSYDRRPVYVEVVSLPTM